MSTSLIAVRLHLYGLELQPSLISERLGLDPYRAHARGQLYRSPSGAEAIRKTGYWAYEETPGESVADMIASLLARLPKDLTLKDLPGVDDGQFDVFCFLDPSASAASHAQVLFGATQIARLSNIGLALDVTVSR